MNGERAAVVPRADELDESQWVIVAAGLGRSVRFAAPVGVGEPGEAGWVEVRALTHREALERESVGTYEECELGDNGRVLSVVRRFDLWAMAEYDYAYAVTDFCLPERRSDGSVAVRRMGDASLEANLVLLGEMPPALAAWMQSCVDRVNLRHVAGQLGLDEAQKKCES